MISIYVPHVPGHSTTYKARSAAPSLQRNPGEGAPLDIDCIRLPSAEKKSMLAAGLTVESAHFM